MPCSANVRNADTHSTGETIANAIPAHAFQRPRSAGFARISRSAPTPTMIAAGVNTANSKRNPSARPAIPSASERFALRLSIGADAGTEVCAGRPARPPPPDRDPGDPDEPGDPGDPGSGDPRRDPGDRQPGDPGDPDEPGDPGDPDEPGDPGDPDEPGDPDDPDEPGDPGDPGDPPVAGARPGSIITAFPRLPRVRLCQSSHGSISTS